MSSDSPDVESNDSRVFVEEEAPSSKDDDGKGYSDSHKESDNVEEEADGVNTNREKHEHDPSKKEEGSKLVVATKKLSRRLSNQLRRQGSSVVESLPKTTMGWAALLATLASAGVGYEVRLQKSLTQPPIVFGQIPPNTLIGSVFQKLTASPECILSRPIRPSLFVGTRGMVASTAAYLFGGPASSEKHLRFREMVHSPMDGASFAVDWEVPWETEDHRISQLTKDERRNEILKGKIREPVVIILHGINNDASFGYMRSLQRSFTERGWNAASMNFRGCGGVPMTTPRGYTGGYTNDLRTMVWSIAGRLAENVPVFLVGNSLGANILAKYLGEEGLSGTLPKCVSGAASLGNPLSINSSLVSFPFNILMALGVKRTYLQNYSFFSKMTDAYHRKTMRNVMLSSTIAEVDNSAAPVLTRNDPFYPFSFRIGFKDGNSYWTDSSSYRLVRYISVPFLNLSAEDDFLVATPNRNRLGYSVANPNIMVAETRCGGHLGWQESPLESKLGTVSSWADVAAADFFDAIMASNQERHGSPLTPHSEHTTMDESFITPEVTMARKELKDEATQFQSSHLNSRL